MVLQGFKEYSKDLSMEFRGVSWEFRGSLEGVSIKSLGCFMGVSRVFVDVSRVFYGCFKGVSWEFQGCFKGVFNVF